MLNDKLSWKPHIVSVTTKATRIFMQCRDMLGKTWGLSPKISRWTYIALIRPILAYGCLIWLKGLTINTQLILLERVQRKACVAILNAMPSAPSAGLEVILNIEPIKIFLQCQAINTFIRLKENGNWIYQPDKDNHKLNHGVLVTNLAEQLPSINMPNDKLLHKQHIRTRFEALILPREEMNRSLKKPKPTSDNTIHCFTDGSRFNDKSGSGYTVHSNLDLHFDGFHHLGGRTTVFQAEIHAITASTHTLLEYEPRGQNIHYFIDNQAAITALGKYEIKNKQILECKQLLNQLSSDNKVRLLWIPGHTGHLGNEVADRKAKLGVRQVVFGPEPILPIGAASVKEDIKNWGKREHQTSWTNLPTCNHTKLMVPLANGKIWRQINKLSRQDIRRKTQMLTGHCTLQKHLVNMKFEQDTTCQQCLEDEETAEHFLADCPAFATVRQQTLGNMFLRRNELKSLKVSNILKFCKETGRFEDN